MVRICKTFLKKRDTRGVGGIKDKSHQYADENNRNIVNPSEAGTFELQFGLFFD